MSMLALTPKHQLRPGLAQLGADVASGAWETRHAELLDQAALDLGYRLLTADTSRGSGANISSLSTRKTAGQPATNTPNSET